VTKVRIIGYCPRFVNEFGAKDWSQGIQMTLKGGGSGNCLPVTQNIERKGGLRQWQLRCYQGIMGMAVHCCLN